VVSTNGNLRRVTIRAGRLARAFFAAALSVALVGCSAKKEPQDEGLVFYHTDFSSPDELKNWKCNDSGKWEIRKGWLVADARIPENRSILWLNKPIARNVQIEFDAECLEEPGDINCFICGNGKNYSGYEVIIGGFNNEKVGVYKSKVDGDDMERKRLEREPFELEKKRVYTVKVKLYKGTIRVYVDNELLITATDNDPIEDPEHRYFGLSTFQNVVRFDNLKIEKKE